MPSDGQLKKRPHGEGHVRLRADGRWEAIASIDGRPRSFYGRGPTPREALRKMRQAQRAAEAGLPLGPERVTVGRFLRDWLVHTAKPRVRHSTYVSYEAIARKHLIPALGKIRLRQLTPQRVQTLLNQKLQAGLSPRRVQFIRAVLRAALTDAEKWGMVPRNVAALVDPPKQEKQRKNPLSPKEAEEILEAIRGDRLAPLFTLILATGVRPGEALGLRWEDVDVERREMHVRHGLHWIDGEPVLLPPKNERSVRTIPVADEALIPLEAHRVRQLEARLRAGEAWEETGFVFTTRIGRPLRATDVHRAFNKLLAKAGLPRMRLYDLRHACASFLLAMGVDLKRISEILGHADISTTANVYAHVMPAMMRDAADKMDALLRSLRRTT